MENGIYCQQPISVFPMLFHRFSTGVEKFVESGENDQQPEISFLISLISEENKGSEKIFAAMRLKEEMIVE